MRVSEIRVNQIRVNQGLGVIWEKNDGRFLATHFSTNSISEKTEKFIFSTNYIGT